MNFSDALNTIKAGGKLARSGWNGKDQFVFLVPSSVLRVNRLPLLGIYPEGTEISYQAHIGIKTQDGSIVPWVASQADILADDWYFVK